MRALNALLLLDEQARTWVDLGLLSEQSGVSISRLKRSAWRAANMGLAQVATRIDRTVVLRQDIDLAVSFLKTDQHTLQLRQACYLASRKYRTGKANGRPRISAEKQHAILASLAAGKTMYRTAKENRVSQTTVKFIADRAAGR
jgi:hypothetical protein